MTHPTGTRCIPADCEEAFYEGRYAVSANHGVRVAYPGVTLHLRAVASTVAVRLLVDKVAAFDLSVDGGSFKAVVLGEGPNVIDLLGRGGPGEHQIELVRRTEAWQGTCDFESIEVSEGGRLLPVARPQGKLLFIGDSITCGEGVVPASAGEGADPVRSNARLSYGKLLAATLGAQCHLVSYGGRGVMRDWQGIMATNNAPQFYERSLPDDPLATWDFARYVPDAIGVCLGQNDFNQGVPDENAFVNTYAEFVLKLRRDAPAASIFLIDSPMLVDSPGIVPKRTIAASFIDRVIERVGSPAVRHVRLPHFPGSAGDAHPTAESHVGIAGFLEPFFSEALGRSRKPAKA